MSELTVQEKAMALNALSEIAIKIRDDGSWYVLQSVEVKEKSTLVGNYGNGDTPTDAILDHWDQIVTNLPRTKYLVLNAYGDNRKSVRWNGFMWSEVMEEQDRRANDADS